jgi:multiple sugar transport system substrate-binding protein
VVLLAAVLGACRSADGDGVTLRVLHWAGDYEVTREQAIADHFSRTHPGVRVVVESVVTNYDEKLLTSIASGTPPDVFLLDGPDIPTFLDRGLALDLTPYLERAGYDPERVFPQVMEGFRRNGRVFALPKDFTPMVLYLNMDVFHRFGVEPPDSGGWTWGDFQAAARRLTHDVDGDGRTDVYAIDFPRNLYQWIPWVWSAGTDILNPEGTRATGYLDAPATVDVFRFLTGLVTDAEVTPGVHFLETGDPAREARFATGAQAMLESGHWTLQLLYSNMDGRDLHLSIAPIPHEAGARPETVLYASGWAVPTNAVHRRLSVELAAWLASEEAQRMRAETRLGIPVFQDVAREIAAQDTSGLEAEFLAQARHGRVTWGTRVRDFYEVEELTFQIMDRHLLRGEPLARAASQVAAQVDEVLKP